MTNYLFKKKEEFFLSDLEEVISCIEKCNVNYWIDGGTLLAIIRDDKLFPHLYDGDVDLGILWNEEQYYKVEKLKKILRKSGFELKVGYFSISIRRPIVKSFSLKVLNRLFKWHKGKNLLSKSLINISLSRVSGNYAWCTWMNKKGIDYIPRVVPLKFYENLEKIHFRGVSLPVPNNTEDYLSYKYGRGWKEKNSDWVYYKDDGTIDKNWISKKEYQNW